ncbi:hypothetical protein [Streptomyces sp. NBC_00986]|uniref:hypothetical protein n=1 Tax=Streptomyces sp. NBC_00986 TaxID=2903702 RepID=UPI003868D70F|nr:hypothetical protein OG504_00725 [Streptomyces sp. NBC_00986]
MEPVVTDEATAPLALPAAPPVLRLTALALALAAHTANTEHSTDLDALARLCGHSPQQTGELLDRLVTTGALTTWHHNRETDEAVWQLPQSLRTNPPCGSAAKAPDSEALTSMSNSGRHLRGTTGSACP